MAQLPAHLTTAKALTRLCVQVGQSPESIMTMLTERYHLTTEEAQRLLAVAQEQHLSYDKSL